MLNKIEKGMSNAAEKINENFEEIADYVVEQGENYTKWASGKLEIYFEGVANTGNGNNTLTYEHPMLAENKATSAETYIFPALRVTNMSVYLVTLRRAYIGDADIKVDITNDSSTTGQVTMRFYVIGRWKQPDGWDD